MSHPSRSHGSVTARRLALTLGVVALAMGATPAMAENIGGNATSGIPEAGSLALANGLASAALNPSTGVLSASLPIDVPAARGSAQPGLALTYNSAGGVREAGIGWGLAVPKIERRPLEGAPRYYSDNPGKEPTMAWLDRFVFDGSPLEPVCTVGITCGSNVSAPFPSWAGPGTVYFRLEADTSRARFFWSSDRRTWRVQLAGGDVLELGVPLAKPGLFPEAEDSAVDYERTRKASDEPMPFRWNTVRRFGLESAASATNFVAYRWRRLGERGLGLLTDVYDTPAASVPQARTLEEAEFAHHVHIAWDRPPFLRGRAIAAYHATPDLRVSEIAVSSASFASTKRTMLRRYHLDYESIGNRYYLSQYQLEGRCAALAEQPDGTLPTSRCERLPATRLSYSQRHINSIPAPFTHPALPHQKGRSASVTILDVDGDSLPDLLENKLASPPQASQAVHFNHFDWYTTKIRETQAPPSENPPPNLFSNVGTTIVTSTLRGNTYDRKADGAGAIWLGPFTTSTSPIPLEGYGRAAKQDPASGEWMWSLLFNAIGTPEPNWRTAGLGDTDGDGLLDMVMQYDASRPAPVSALPSWQTDGRTLTRSLAFMNSTYPSDYEYSLSCSGPSPKTVQTFAWPDGTVASSITDLNGDGVGDLAFATLRKSSTGRSFLGIRYWPSDGRGDFSACTAAPCPCTDATREAPSIRFPELELGLEAGAQIMPQEVGLADVNGDGFSDLVVATPDFVNVYWNQDGSSWGDLTAPNLTIEGYHFDAEWKDNWPPRMTFADMNGNGVTDIVFVVGGNVRFLDTETFMTWPIGATRPGLLTKIENGLGASTEIAYESSTVLAKYVRSNEPRWRLPQTQYVVQHISSTTGLPGESAEVVTYRYAKPVYDRDERRFKGFENVRIDSDFTATELTYFIGTKGSIYNGSLLIASDTSTRATSAVSSSTVVYSYKVSYGESHVGQMAYADSVDTFLYDTNAPQTSMTTATAAVDSGRERWSAPITIRSMNNARLRTTVATDGYGSVTERIDHGRVTAGGKAWDEPLRRTFEFHPLDENWRFLVKAVTLDGFPDQTALGFPPDHQRKRQFEYDSSGRLSNIYASLTGTMPLDRRHENVSRDVAPTPDSASKDGTVRLLHNDYDAFGNVVSAEGPSGACGVTTYDKEYAQLVVRGAQFKAGCNGAALTTSSVWDRGFGMPVRQTAADGTTGSVDVDLFGRLVAIHEPDAETGLPADTPSRTIIHHLTVNGPVQRVEQIDAVGAGRTHSSWTYFDGFGRELLALDQADPRAGDEGTWVASGLPPKENGRIVGRREPWFYSGDPANHPLTDPGAPATRIERDVFGRLSAAYNLDGSLRIRRVYKPLEKQDTDVRGRVTVTRTDGHGRVKELVEMAGFDQVTTRLSYQAAGSPSYILQSHGGQPGGVGRSIYYDSLGRMVLNSEPNTSTREPGVGLRAWRYAYDDAGRVVGTSDARGCGKNILYDGLGRKVAEDFSPCLSAQETYSAADLTSGNGAEVLHTYDAAEAGQTPEFGRTDALVGRLTATRDRAAHTRSSYDKRGRVTTLSRQIRRPVAHDGEASGVAPAAGVGALSRELESRRFASARWYLAAFAALAAIASRALRRARRELNGSLPSLGSFAAMVLFVTACSGATGSGGERVGRAGSALADASYEQTWSRKSFAYDLADRIVTESTGADVPGLLAANGTSEVTTEYSLRGLPARQGGSYGPLVVGQVFAADGLAVQRSYADAAGTVSSSLYDARRRLEHYSVGRSSMGPWTNGPAYTPAPGGDDSLQRNLLDNRFTYDTTGRLSQIADLREPAEWGAGFKPVSRALGYDGFDRVARVDYTYHGSPAWRDPLATERNTPVSPVPVVTSVARVGTQTYGYDWRGNIISSGDDASMLYDRSLGDVLLGGPGSGPDQIRSASAGAIAASHDAAGNLTDLLVKREGACADAAGCTQQYHYDWDEVGQLARARRWDFVHPNDVPLSPPLPASEPAVDLRYLYDATGARVLKESVGSGAPEARFTIEAFSSLRLESATWDDASEAYRRDVDTEVVYLGSVGRLAYGPGLPSASGSPLHVLLTAPDHLGSASVVIDRDTGELVERTTQQAYGLLESDYRPARWQALREPYQFTGKEEDLGVGLTYFGARYYSGALGRFISPDPLTIHALSGDSNPYAYVGGGVLSATDPFGLSCAGSIGAEMCPGESAGWGPMQPPGTNYGVFLPNPDAGSGSGPGVLRLPPPGRASAFSAGPGVMGNGLNPTMPMRVRALPATFPEEFADQDIPAGTPKQFGVAAWNGAVHAFPTLPGDMLTRGLLNRYLLVADDDPTSWAGVAGSVAPMVAMAAMGGFGGGAEMIESRVAGAAEGASIRVSAKGIARVEAHLGKLGALDEPANAAMLGRLRAGERTVQDLNFYMHELKESAVMTRTGGYGTYEGARAAHLETLQWQRIPYVAGYESRLYHRTVIRAFSEIFNPAAWPK